ncbi:histidine phosphatase superfamily [Powellomyces hirtus]|nr:histidine phosphatase superfamily [Powellomyces hirtus]
MPERPPPPRLAHRAFILRHGESVANVRNLIVSSVQDGCGGGYGLTPVGREQAEAAAHYLSTHLLPTTPLKIYTSDFTRALETAHIVANHFTRNLNVTVSGPAADSEEVVGEEVLLGPAVTLPLTVTPIPCLRERFFGIYDGCANDLYQVVWDADRRRGGTSTHCGGDDSDGVGIETPEAVLQRALEGVLHADRQVEEQDAVLLFVSHGDTLQILQTAFEGLAPCDHRSLPPLATAEVRELVTVDRGGGTFV